MRKFALSLAAAAVLCTAAVLSAPAQAMPTGLTSQFGHAIDGHSMVEKTQFFFFGGRNYCFYLDGWHGPGWYWCGYRWRRGYGWGGPEGWHGRYRHHRRYERRHERRYERRHERRERHRDRHRR